MDSADMNISRGDSSSSSLGSRDSVQSGPVDEKISESFESQRLFFKTMGEGLEDNVKNRDKMLSILNEGKSYLSTETAAALRTLLSSKVTRSFSSIIGWAKNSSLSTKILRQMNPEERKLYFEQDGCKEGVGRGHYVDALREMGRFIAERDSTLNLSGGKLAALPECVFTRELKELDCSYNTSLTKLPAASTQCVNLKRVDFTGSGIKAFNFTMCKKLQEINLTHTPMKEMKNRRTISEGLPVGVLVVIEGLESGMAGWPDNVKVKSLGRNKVEVTVLGPLGEVNSTKEVKKTTPKPIEKSVCTPEELNGLKSDGFSMGDGQAAKSNEKGVVRTIVDFIVQNKIFLNLREVHIRTLPRTAMTRFLETLDCRGNQNLESLPGGGKDCTNLKRADFALSNIGSFDFTNSPNLEAIDLTFTPLRRIENRAEIVKGLPFDVPVKMKGLDAPLQHWPSNVRVEDLGNGNVRVTVSKIELSDPSSLIGDDDL